MTRRRLSEWRRQWRLATSLDEEELEELYEHLVESVRTGREEGLSEEEAVRAALDRLGSPSEVVREYDKIRSSPARRRSVVGLSLDLRYALRQLRAHPFFTTVAVSSIAVAVAVNTVAFGVINGVLLRDPGYGESERLVEIYTSEVDDPATTPVASWPIVEDLRAFETLFDDLVGYEPIFGRMLVEGSYMPILGEAVGGRFFDVLRVRPAIGRGFTREDASGRSRVVVISHDVWRNRFEGSSDVLGTRVEVNGEPMTVVGVAPDGFLGGIPGVKSHVWVPIWTLPLGRPAPTDRPGPEADRGRWQNQIKARLRSGVTAETAQGALAGNAARLAAMHPESYSEVRFSVIPTDDIAISPALDGMAFSMAGGVMAVVAMVLVIASMNLAGFLLARGSDRWSELRLRHALGATRRRLVGQLFSESLAIAAAGGILGLGLCHLLLDVASRYRPPIPVFLEFDFSVDGNVLLFTVAASATAALLFGLIPALRSTRGGWGRGIARLAESRVSGSGRIRTALLTAQVAASLVFLVWGGLFSRSLWEEARTDPGFRTRDAAVLTMEMASAGYDRDRLPEFLDRMRSSTARRPELTDIVFSTRIPLGSVSSSVDVGFPGSDTRSGRTERVESFSTSPGYFDALGIRIVEGRAILPSDGRDAPAVVVVSRSFTDRYTGESAAVGDVIDVDGRAMQIVGVAEDVKVERVREAATPHLYRPLSQSGAFILSIVGVAAGSSAEALQALRASLDEVDPGVVVMSSSTMEEHLGLKLMGPRIAAGLLVGSGALALLLTLVGVFGSVSYAVSRRSYEMAIRLSLGASSRSVTRLVVISVLRAIVGGALIGLVLALAGTGVLQGLLYGVGRFDPISFGLATLLLLAAAAVAALLPARRAGRMPLTALLKER